MDKTIKELAEEYGLSKQAIEYHMKKVPKEYKKFDIKNGVKILKVDEKGQKILRDLIPNKAPKLGTKIWCQNQVEELERKIEMLEKEIEILELKNRNYKEKIETLEEIANDDKERINTLIRLLDQQQQLCAISEKKVAELEQKSTEKPKPWWKIW